MSQSATLIETEQPQQTKPSVVDASSLLDYLQSQRNDAYWRNGEQILERVIEHVKKVKE